ncbi:MAG TPA: flippase [bacterium]|jgi:O-antigen/teichoic acid export membrane protein|nr:flippase [bacterium]HOQ91926.1 flippase [bacterium]HQA83991.1 flippase [bacterium]
MIRFKNLAKLLKRGITNKYSKGIGWLFVGQFVSLFFSFAVGLTVARYLGPEEYGILSYALSFAGIFTFIASLGADGIISRELAKNDGDESEVLGTGLLLKIAGSIFASLLCCLILFLVPDKQGYRYFVLWSIPVILFQFSNIFNLWFQARILSKWISLSQIGSIVLLAIIKVSLVVFDAPVRFLILAYSLDIVFWAMFGYCFYVLHGGLLNWRLSLKMLFNILKESWLLMLSSASCILLFKIDQVMVGQMLGKLASGYYAVAVKLSEVWYFLPVLISNSVLPALINGQKNSWLVYRRRKFWLLMLLLSFSLLFSIFMLFFAKQLIGLLFGNQFLPATPIAKIYAWSSIGMFLGTGLWVSLVSEAKNKIIFMAYLSALILNIYLNVILIPIIGLSGAAWATVISYSLVPMILLLPGLSHKKIFNQ